MITVATVFLGRLISLSMSNLRIRARPEISAKSFHTLISRLGERAGIESLLLSGNRSQLFRNATDHPPTSDTSSPFSKL